MKEKLEQSREWLRKRWQEDKKSIQQIADEARCSSITIRRALKREGFIK